MKEKIATLLSADSYPGCFQPKLARHVECVARLSTIWKPNSHALTQELSKPGKTRRVMAAREAMAIPKRLTIFTLSLLFCGIHNLRSALLRCRLHLLQFTHPSFHWAIFRRFARLTSLKPTRQTWFICSTRGLRHGHQLHHALLYKSPAFGSCRPAIPSLAHTGAERKARHEPIPRSPEWERWDSMECPSTRWRSFLVTVPSEEVPEELCEVEQAIRNLHGLSELEDEGLRASLVVSDHGPGSLKGLNLLCMTSPGSREVCEDELETSLHPTWIRRWKAPRRRIRCFGLWWSWRPGCQSMGPFGSTIQC